MHFVQYHHSSFVSECFLMQARSDMAREIISAIRKKRGQMIRWVERLCDAYITLANMDASKHKTEKSK